jgi:dihydropteroate synthase
MMKLKWKNFDLDFSKQTFIMGILNVTPDSFSDGGRYLSKESAVEQALRMKEDGADIIDIGGESTRPGAEKVSVQEEIKRIIPVIEEIAKKIDIPLSVDTYKSSVAQAAVSAGASIINDISGLRFDSTMAKVAERLLDKETLDAKALIPEIMDYLAEGVDIARQAGVKDNMIIIDPGIGFGKTVAHNLEIIHRLDEFGGFEKPVMLGHSRKSFIGRLLGGLPAAERLEGTAAAAAIGIFNSANIIRVHDVKEMVRVARVADAIKRGN